jgi:hypothetical protein
MRIDSYTRVVLTAIALFLAMIALRPLVYPAPASAEASSYGLYIEPGVYTLRAPNGQRQQLGKVVVDLRTGSVWGFPTGTADPYPVSITSSEPPVSTPFLLGKFDFRSLEP